MLQTLFTIYSAGLLIGIGAAIQCLIWRGRDRSQTRCGDLIQNLGLGGLALGTAIQFLGWMSLLTPGALGGFTVLLTLLAAWGWWQIRDQVDFAALAPARVVARIRAHPVEAIAVAVAALLILLVALRTLLPPWASTDVIAYHLALPDIWLREGRWVAPPTMHQRYYPQIMTGLYAWAMNLGKVQWAHSIVLIYALGLIRATGRIAAWAGGRRVGGIAMLLMLFFPLWFQYAPQSYVDLPQTFYLAAALYLLLSARKGEGAPTTILFALQCAGAVGVKYLAVPIVALLLLGWLWRSRKRDGFSGKAALTRTLLVAGIVAVVSSPFYLRNLVLTGNPIWPLASGILGAEGYRQDLRAVDGSEVESRVVQSLKHPFKTNPDVLIGGALWHYMLHSKSDHQRQIGPLWIAVLPLVLLFLPGRDPRARALLVCTVTGYLLWVLLFKSIGRYSIVFFVVYAGLCGIALDRFLTRAPKLRYLVYGFAALYGVFCLFWMGTKIYRHSDYLLGRESDESFLRRLEPRFVASEAVNALTEPGDKVLLMGMVAGLWIDVPYIWDHPFQTIIQYDKEPSAAAAAEHLRELGIKYILRPYPFPRDRVVVYLYPDYDHDPRLIELQERYFELVERLPGYLLYRLKERSEP